MKLIPSKTISTLVMAFVFMASWIAPIWPAEQALHSSLSLVAFWVLWFYRHKWNLSDANYFYIIIFLCVHTIAARWLYTNIPYEQWLQNLIGFSFKEQLGWTRNHFDRLVHFSYGLCFTPALHAYLTQQYKLLAKHAFVMAICAIMISSLFYEWFEWLIAVTLSAENAEAYNGQQGDIWDAHKDMLLATIGSLLCFRLIGKTRP